MALTDALSVACKAIGIGADVYFAKDRTKYDENKPSNTPPPQVSAPVRDKEMIASLEEVRLAATEDKLKQIWTSHTQYQKDNTFITAVNMRKAELTKK